MRPEVRWVLAAIAALAVGVMLAEPYARLAAPYYDGIANLLAAVRPWKVTGVTVKPGRTRLSAELQLEGYVSRHVEDATPAVRVIGREQVGEAVETPMVFWTLLLLWPARSLGHRAARLAIGVPVWLGLEAATTACQLILPLVQASAILAGEHDPVTLLDRWCRFLEAGGQFALICGCAVLICAA